MVLKIHLIIPLFGLFIIHAEQLHAFQKDSLLAAIDTASNTKIKLQAELDLASYYIDETVHDSAVVIINEVINKSQQLRQIKADAYTLLAYNYDISGNLKLSIENYENARVIFEELGDKKRVAECLHYKGTSAYFKGDYELAMDYYLQTLDYTEGLGLLQQRANTMNNLGVIYRISGKNRQAIEMYKGVLAGHRKMDNLEGVAQQHNNLGVAYTYLYNLDSALIYLDSAMMRYQITQDTYDLAFTYTSIGDAYYEAGKDLTNARINLLKANELFQVSSNQFVLSKNYLFLGEVELEDGNPKSAVTYLEKGLKVLEGTDREDIRLDLLETLQQAYAELGMTSKAYEYLLAHKSLNKELYAKDKVEYLEEMQTKYDTEQKEKRIEIQNLQLDQQQKDKRNLRIILSLLLAGLVSSVLFIWNTIRSKNLISEQKTIIEKSLSEKEILLKEIHHRVKNNLQVISSILTLQGRYSNDPLIEGAIKKGKDRVRSMALIHENLYKKDNLAGINMNEYLNKLFKSLFNSYNISGDQIQLELDIQNIHLDVDTVVPIGLAVNELITNALKYAFPDNRNGVIKVSLLEKDKELILTVQDNGVGMQNSPKSEESTGFGFELIDAFKSKLNAELNVISEYGTRVQMIIKNYQIVS